MILCCCIYKHILSQCCNKWPHVYLKWSCCVYLPPVFPLLFAASFAQCSYTYKLWYFAVIFINIHWYMCIYWTNSPINDLMSISKTLKRISDRPRSISRRFPASFRRLFCPECACDGDSALFTTTWTRDLFAATLNIFWNSFIQYFILFLYTIYLLQFYIQYI